MAQFDTSTIEGFDGMTAEEQVKALLGAEIPDSVDMSKFISKDLFDKKASELAEANKKLKSKMTEDEQKKLADDEAKAAEAQKFADLESKYNELVKSSTLKEHTISLTGLGFEENLAKETASAIVDGDAGKLFANMKKFLESFKQSIEKELMDKTPNPGGNGKTGEDDEAIKHAKSLFGDQSKAGKSYDDVLSHYLKK